MSDQDEAARIADSYIDIVFDGPPSHVSGRFVEVEDETGRSIKFGDWVHRQDGCWALRFTPSYETEWEELRAENDRLRAALANSKDPCVYCQLPAEKMAECRSGFPGCDRADDMGGCPERGAAFEAHFLREERDELKARAEKAEARADRLAKALEPFAREAGRYDPDEGDDGDELWGVGGSVLRLGDLRRAREALAPPQPEPGKEERI